jgi:hypothetical protein
VDVHNRRRALYLHVVLMLAAGRRTAAVPRSYAGLGLIAGAMTSFDGCGT